LIRALWTGDKVTWRGIHYQTRKAKLYTRCDNPIPLFISAMVPNSARFAGNHGDGLITVGGKEPDQYCEILRNFADGAREAGKDPGDMPRMIELGVDFTADTEQAIALRKDYWAGVFIPALFTEKIYTAKMSEQNGAAVAPKRFAVACTFPPSQKNISVMLGATSIWDSTI
jgi:coenzyme F420-dependent glucose-6-phosphate dehydrogenase